MRPPIPRRPALFLDVDGTLIPLASRPQALRADLELLLQLSWLRETLDGAVALLSGRTLAHLAEGFAPLCLPAAGTHGLEIQHVDGRIEHPIEPPRQWPKVRVAVEAMALADPSLQIENKGNAIAVHYRATAHRAAELRRRMCELAQRLGPDYHVQEGLYLLELKPAAVNKGTALRTFMASQPFAGRVPVAAGDDLSDLHAFRQAELLGGFGIAVGDRVEAAWRLPDPAAFRAWLVQIARAA